MGKVEDAVAALKPELWTASLNDAMSIYITDTKGAARSFKPQFTYPFFGDAQTIFGYQNLQIFLCFDAVTALPFLNVKWSASLPKVDVDVKAILLEQLPESTIYKDEASWRDEIEKEQQDYKIPGTRVGENWCQNGDTWALYKLDLGTAAGLELHMRIRIFSLLFIEAASYFDPKDPLWEVYVMYNVNDEKFPEIVGFTTAYNFWKYPGHEKFDAGIKSIRKKISQFIVLPFYQGQRLGSQMYGRLFESWLEDDTIVEIVVEDPNENFDEIRDRVDMTRLIENGYIDLQTISIESVSQKGWFETFQKEQKIEKRQLQRLLEMIFLHQQKSGLGKETIQSVRKFIKRRLYEKNIEYLVDLEQADRFDKLQTTYLASEEGYLKTLGPLRFKKRKDSGALGASKKLKI